jgi:glycyl-tRNA synthetase
MAEPKVNELMEKIVSLCKRRGFIYPSSEIYGGINGFWDYGPLGAELKRNVKDLWWRSMVQSREDVEGLEATIIMHPQIWRASGHVDTFTDPMCDCLLTRKRFRADQIEPQSGTAYYFEGMIEHPSGTEFREPYAVLIAKDKHPQYARQTAIDYYKTRGVTGELFGERSEDVVDSQRFNPDNGSLLTEPRPFNLMFKTTVGPVADDDNVAYLRPETAQAIFVQFKNVMETSRQKVPFGIAQIGKAFRNEVTPRNYTFRSREFEQMELEYFIFPDEIVQALHGNVSAVESEGHPGEPQEQWGWQVWHKYWVEERLRFYESIGLPRQTLVEYWQKPEELAHYARATVDLLYKFPFGTQELEGIAARSDFDLTQHERYSGKPMGVFEEGVRTAWKQLAVEKQSELKSAYRADRLRAAEASGKPADIASAQADEETQVYFDKLAKGQFIPHVIEPSAGVDRLILALLCQAYHEVVETDSNGKSQSRVILRLSPKVAPIKAAILPLLKNKPEIVAIARALHQELKQEMSVFYDATGSIGRRYARQDEAGTPFCITIDFETLGEQPNLKDTVTIRHRDDGRQERLPLAGLKDWLRSQIF